MNYNLDDTIVAVGTPLGIGAIGIIRMSGKEALKIAQAIFIPRKEKKIKDYRAHSLYYGYIQDPQQGGRRIDEVLLCIMRGPRSFTREDIVEINCHSGLLILQEILSCCIRLGARMASPGEFSLRAFLNGALDLTQAEAICDIIQAKTSSALDIGLSNLAGRLSAEINYLRDVLLDVLAPLEAELDFPEEELPSNLEETSDRLEEILEKINHLLASADRGIVLQQGIRVLILGRPNVGKSSLFNLLLARDRAIVSDIPGTTRDILEEIIDIKGIPIQLIDSAGVIPEPDYIEGLGIGRTLDCLKSVDIVLLVLEAQNPLLEQDYNIINLLKEKKQTKIIIVVNKMDLGKCLIGIKDIPFKEKVYISCIDKQGIEELEACLYRMVSANKDICDYSGQATVNNIRQKLSLEEAGNAVKEALSIIKSGDSTELCCLEIHRAINSLAEITGEGHNPDILERIFSRFCIGK